jgi:hypothetical protein
LDYGNAKTLDATYNSRLQAASFIIPGVMSKTYDYYADGRLRFSSDLLNHKMDRFNSYDHAGRIKEAFSGAEARGESQTNNRPYRETFGYDALGHLTARANDIWRDSFTIADSYLNNRHPDWSYDADGNLLAGADSSYTYDAMGEIRTVASFVPVSSTTRGLDGAGQQVKTDETAYNEQTQSSTTTTKYYLHSSVLGGQVLTEIDADGAKLRTFVYAGGSVLAWQVQQGTVQRVVWEHRDPSDASFRTTDPSGYPWGHADEEEAAELDPTGGNAGLIAPIVEPGPPPDEVNDSLIPYPRFHDARRASITYAVDYVQVTVDYFFQQLDIGSHGSLIGSSLRADTANYSRRWVQAGTLTIIDNSGPKDPATDFVVGNTVVVSLGYWQSIRESHAPSWSWLIPTPPPQPQNSSPDRYIPDKYKKQFNAALTEAEKRLGKDDCAKLFGRSTTDLIAMLQGTEYRYLTLPSGGPKLNRDTGAASVVGAGTNSPTSVFINDKGPFFNNRMFVPGKSGLTTFDFGSRLIGAAFGALLLLHELGHQADVFGPDAGDDKLNREHTRRVQKSCF